MSRVRIHNISISLDGLATGEGQTLESPFGHAGHADPTNTARRSVSRAAGARLVRGRA